MSESKTPRTDKHRNLAAKMLESAATNMAFIQAVKDSMQLLIANGDDLETELAAATVEHVRSMAHHGQFISDICYAAFGHRDALTDEQIVASLREMRRELTAALARENRMRQVLVQDCPSGDANSYCEDDCKECWREWSAAKSKENN